MNQISFDFILIDEAEAKLEDFLAHLSILISFEELHDEKEIRVSFAYITDLMEDIAAPFLFLEVSRRILVEKAEIYGNILAITSNVNKIIETNNFIKEECDKDEYYENSLVSSILFLIPYSIDYFQETNEVNCFIHLFLSLQKLVNLYSDDFSNLFNEYIGSLLINENPYHDIIAMFYASKCFVKDEIAEMLITKIQILLNDLPTSDLNNDIIRFNYQMIFNNLKHFLTNSILREALNPAFFLQSMGNFMENLIHKFQNDQGQIIDHYIQITDLIIRYCIYLIQYYQTSDIHAENQEIGGFISNLVSLFYCHFLDINKLSNFYLSNRISEFLLRFSDIINIQLIEEKPNYFINLIFQLSIQPLNSDEFLEPEEFLFIDFYDINLNDFNFLSNRQNVAQFIYSLTSRIKNFQIVILIMRYLKSISIEKVKEPHFFFLSILNLVVSSFSSDNRSILLELYNLFLKYFDMSITILKNDIFTGIQKVLFNFTYLFFINSSFYILKMNEDKEEIPDIIDCFNQEIVNLMELVSNVPEEPPYDDFYRIYFTYFCILTNKLIDYESIDIKPEKIFEFADKYSNLCITNDSITLKLKFYNGENTEFVTNLFDQYMLDCISSIDKYNKCMSLKMNGKSENDDDEELNPERILRFFEDNVTKMSEMIKNDDISNFNIESILEFAELLISTDKTEWKFVSECDEFMSAVISQMPDICAITEKYFETIIEYDRCNCSEWSKPISRVISRRPDLIDQQYYDLVTAFMKEYIENNVELDDGDEEDDEDEGVRKRLETKDALIMFSLITRLFEVSLLNQIEIPPDDFFYFIGFALETQPNEQDCDICDDYNAVGHELGSLFVKLASFLVDQTAEPDAIVEFLAMLVQDNKIVCQEMRYIIIFLIDNVIKRDDDEDIQNLRFLCLKDVISKNEEYERSYVDFYDYLIGDEMHPICRIYPIDDFVFDN